MNEEQRRRRFLVGVIAVVGLIGVTGTTIALLSDGSTTTPTSESTPGTVVDPMTIPGQCRSAEVARFSLETGSSEPELTATAAVGPWVLSGESTASTSTGETGKLVSIGVPGELPRVVLAVEKQARGWLVTETGACLESAGTDATECSEETLRIGRTEYRRAPEPAPASDPSTASAGRFVGSGTFRGCPEQVEGSVLVPRGPVGPVSVYAVPGEPDAVVVASAEGARIFRR